MPSPPSAPLKPNPIRGRRPVLQNCTIAELRIDPAYQRSIDNGHSRKLIRSIARDWDWTLCQPLVVIKYRENLALRDLVRPFATAGLELEAAMSAAYRRGLADAGVIPAGSPLLNLKQRVRV